MCLPFFPSMDDTRKRLIQIAAGVLVEQDVLNIVEKIRAYDPNLRVKYCSVSGSIADAPYKLTEMCPDGVERVVFSIWDLDERVLERLYSADTQRSNILIEIDKKNAANNKLIQRRYQEKVAEATDIFASYLRSPKTTYSFRDPMTGNKITVDDQPGRKAKVERQ